jgi:hypothetical protein
MSRPDYPGLSQAWRSCPRSCPRSWSIRPSVSAPSRRCRRTLVGRQRAPDHRPAQCTGSVVSQPPSRSRGYPPLPQLIVCLIWRGRTSSLRHRRPSSRGRDYLRPRRVVWLRRPSVTSMVVRIRRPSGARHVDHRRLVCGGCSKRRWSWRSGDLLQSSAVIMPWRAPSVQ